ncbi:flavin reductase family protein [Gordonia sp. VNK21]|uniref:flavin reductase family protein n=1 Tax=Gordonia sp. VNK21 TaxID=3382483 RepID=UPI0038D40EAA
MNHDAELRPASDLAELRRAYSCFPSGVVAVCRQSGGGPLGMSASSFTTVSLEPPLVSVCVRQESGTWRTLREQTRLGVSVFAADQGELCRQLAGPSPGRFNGVQPIPGDDGELFIPGATAHLAVEIAGEVPAGDHLVVLLRVRALRSDHEAAPLVFHGSSFHALSPHASQR